MHKKILYIAPYREMTGYGNSARNYIEALNKWSQKNYRKTNSSK